MRRVLYLGLNAPIEKHVDHVPIIQIQEKQFESPDIREAFAHLDTLSHVVLTSQTGVHLFFKALAHFKVHLPSHIQFVVVGTKTAAALEKYVTAIPHVPKVETAEGMIELFEASIKDVTHILWPHSALSRSNIRDHFTSKKVLFHECVLYTTVPAEMAKLPNLDDYDEIIFTSPSTIDAFVHHYKTLPKNKKMTTIGPITNAYLAQVLAVVTLKSKGETHG